MVQPVPTSSTNQNSHRQQIATALNALIARLQGTDEPNITTAQGNITTLQGDVATLQSAVTTLQGDITAMQTSLTASLSADVALNNTADYFDGPSVAQGSTGTWFVLATVTCTDTAAATFEAKVWDGTTIISSGGDTLAVANDFSIISLSGIITAPAGNLRISVKDVSTANGKILFNGTGNSKDSTITAIRLK